MSRLLRLLRDHSDAVEAALLPTVDLLDHWRYQPGDPRYLTLRRIAVLVRWLPPGNPIDRAVSGRYWTPEMQLADDLRRDVRGAAGDKDPKPHPMSPHSHMKGRPVSPERQKKLNQAKARARRRRRDLGVSAVGG
jgi:hypothetical protein